MKNKIVINGSVGNIQVGDNNVTQEEWDEIVYAEREEVADSDMKELEALASEIVDMMKGKT
jgi:hypothetical protein